MEVENIKKNVKLLINNIPYNVVEAEFVKPGKGRAIYRLRLMNLRDNTTLDRTYHSGEKVEEANVATEEKQFLYREGDRYIFMDTRTFEQEFIPESQMGEKRFFLKEGSVITALMFGETLLDITLPTFVELKVTNAEMSHKSDTVTNQDKSATLETGYQIGVPAFIKEGDIIKVDTRTGNYVERITGPKK